MAKVKNNRVITTIAGRSMKSRRSRNLIAVLAIALTSLLFTSLFTIGGSILQKTRETTFRQIGTSAHAGFKYLTWAQYDTVCADPKVKDPSCRISLADAENPELIKVRTEMAWYEDLDAKRSFCYPETGHMPEEKYDIVASTLTLEALGIPLKPGAKIPLEFTIRGKHYKQEFTLSGWYEGDLVAAVQPACLSKEFAEEVAPMPDYTYQEGNGGMEDVPGRVMVNFNFSSSFNLEKQMEELTRRIGFEHVPSGTNWAYFSHSVDPETLLFTGAFLALILLSGYLIIYNIFYINVYGDIRFFGLLKTIGTTGKQLRRIVRRQAWMLSLAGIPLGLLLGWLCGSRLLPLITENLSLGTTRVQTAANPWIFLGAAAFSLLTVYISSLRPCRIASRISPIEAVRYTESQDSASGKVRKKKTLTKKTRKVTMASFAAENLKRSRKKAIIVILSLGLSLTLMNSVYTLVSGFDIEKYAENMSICDYQVSAAAAENASTAFSHDISMPDNFMDELKSQVWTKDAEEVWYQSRRFTFTPEEYERFETRIWSRMEELFASDISHIPNFSEYVDKTYRNDYSADGKIYGIEKIAFDHLEVKSGTLDWEKFQTGDYIITNSRRNDSNGETADFYDVGETVTLTNKKGETRSYQVMAVAKMPKAASLEIYGMVDLTYVLPTEEFKWYADAPIRLKTLYNVEEGSLPEAEQWISNYCSKIDPALTYTSKATILEEFRSLTLMFSVVGGALSFILALIGILNFINTTITGILARRREFAMIEAVGMTGKQMKQMLIWEGGYYAACTLILALGVSTVLSLTVVHSLENTFDFFVWKFTVLPLGLCLPVLLAVICAVPILAYRKMCRDSVVERIRTAE